MAKIQKVTNTIEGKYLGCDVVTLDRNTYGAFADYLQQRKIPVIKVTIRQKGPSLRGWQEECWRNVAQAQKTWGGEIVLGWAVRFLPITLQSIQLVGHAIWMNDKGQLSCVTKSNWPKDEKEFLFIVHKRKVEIGETTLNIGITPAYGLYVVYSYIVKKGFITHGKGSLKRLDLSSTNNDLTVDMFKAGGWFENPPKTASGKKGAMSQEQIRKSWATTRSQFSEPSIPKRKRTWDQILNERLKRIAKAKREARLEKRRAREERTIQT